METLPPGPRMPAALSTLGWIARPGPLLERCRARYGDVFTFRLAHEAPWVVLSHPDAIKQVFTGDPRVFHAGEANAILRPVLGQHSVLLLDDAPHLAQRKLLLPPFHGERMQRYGELMAEIARREIATWPRETPLSLAPRMQRVTLEVIVRAVFGVTDPQRAARIRDVLKAALDWLTTPRQSLVLTLLGPDRIGRMPAFRRVFGAVDRELLEHIRASRAASERELEQREDILALLLRARHEDGRPMSEHELRDELMTLLVAGHETTATALSWALERLIRHPDAMRRLGEGDDAYLEATCKETLRLRPVLPVVVRVLKEPVEIAGHDLPAGAAVAPCIYLVHRRPDVYPEPHRFRPERFLEGPNGEPPAGGTYTWIPFGGGIRRCLGASFALFEMHTVLREVVRAAAPRPARPAPERTSRRAITLVPARGAEVVCPA